MGRTQTQKKPAIQPKRKPQPGQPKKTRTTPVQFLREVRAELKKVTWPTRKELAQSTVMVLIILVVVTAIIAVMDYIFAQASLLLQ